LRVFGVISERRRYAGDVEHIEFLERPTLTEPPLICAFRGWNDGGEAASVAARYMIERWSARKVAVLDPEEFYDFQVSRPTVRLEEGVSRVIEWPAGEFWAASVGGKDVLVFLAAEPNVRWKTFAASVIGAATQMGSRLLVTLGAFLTDVPHSRPVPVVGSAADEETAGRLGLARSQYEGPTGIVGVLHDASNRAGLSSISIWAAVPHYLPAAPNPKAALALVLRVSGLLEIEVPTEALRGAVAAWEHGVAQLIGESDELAEYVSRLEGTADEGEPEIHLSDEPVPSGDSIAAELERFLREQGGGNG
jgi:predicted ATP-grasp superfamily ATP-dependent carboligase